MSTRLQELLRQRALLAEHSAWLEQEIDAEKRRAPERVPSTAPLPPVIAATSAAAPAPAPVPPPLAAAAPRPAAPPPTTAQVASDAEAGSDAEAAAILEQYSRSPRSLQQEVRRGCFLYFFSALVLLALGLLAIHLLRPGK